MGLNLKKGAHYWDVFLDILALFPFFFLLILSHVRMCP